MLLDFLKKSNTLIVLFQKYGPGKMKTEAERMQTGTVKKRLIEVLTEIVERHCRARAAISDEVNSI